MTIENPLQWPECVFPIAREAWQRRIVALIVLPVRKERTAPVDRFTRIFLLHRILSNSRRPVPRAQLESELECSPASVKRILRELRDYLGAPLEYDREANGYFYAQASGVAFELPGLWFSAKELFAMASLQAVLAELSPGLLGGMLRPVRDRMETLLQSESLGLMQLPHRVRLLGMASRVPEPAAFQCAAEATLQRRRLSVRYHARGDDASRTRILSPQRLLLYRHNWYLDAWCHLREALRTFAVERLLEVRLIEEPAREIADAELDAHYTEGYGLFAGPATEMALLRFEPTAARWVAEESWHPRQQGEWLADGRYELRLPYSDPTELVMDVLRYGAEVEVVGPPGLRARLQTQLAAALQKYVGTGSGSEPVAVVEGFHGD